MSSALRDPVRSWVLVPWYGLVAVVDGYPKQMPVLSEPYVPTSCAALPASCRLPNQGPVTAKSLEATEELHPLV